MKLRERFGEYMVEAIVAGVSFGLVECVFTSMTGIAPASDMVLIMASGIGALAALAIVTGLLLPGPLRRQGGWLASYLIVAAPVGLLALRGNVHDAALAERWWVSALRGPFSSALLLSLLGMAAFRADAVTRRIPLRTFWSLCCAAFAVAVACLSMRVMDAASAPSLLSATLAVGTAAILLRQVLPHEGVMSLHRLSLLIGLGVALPVTLNHATRERPPELSKAAGGVKRPASAPSVLLIVLDTARRDHLTPYSYTRDTTPRLQDLSGTATVFENAYATAPYTLSSHASLFTGLLPSDHGAHPLPFTQVKRKLSRPIADIPLGTEHATIAELFAREGHATAGIVANSGYLGLGTGLSRGFEYFDSRLERLYGYTPTIVTGLLRMAPLLRGRFFTAWNKGTREADAITDQAIQWLGRLQGRRFFLFLNYFDAHLPYVPPPRYARLFPAPAARHDVSDPEGRVESSADLELAISQYDGALAFVDYEIGRLIEWLSRRDGWEDTLVIVTSDHGEFLGERGLTGHGKTLHQPVLRIPLIVKWPRQRTARRESTLVSLVDVFQIMKSGLEGREYRAPARDGSTVIAEYWTPLHYYLRDPKRFNSPALRAVFFDRYKVVQRVGAASELYDLTEDPDEQADLAHDQEELVRRIIASVAAFDADRPFAPGVMKLDPDVLRRLRALGYLQ